MHNSDDYFTDDIVFDEQALAVLDQEESRFIQSSRISHNPPPPKRQKTDYGWRALGSRVDSFNDQEDLPEISVQNDGSYGLGSSRTANLVSSSGWHRGAQNRQPQGQPSLRNVSLPPGPQASPQRQSSADIQLDELRKQIEELRKGNLKIKEALQEAVDAKLAKEGEVSILRKSMQKTAQDHATQVTKLRAAKEEADAKQAQARKEMKDEMERLRTQFTFKQHELETSVRKPPWSVRSKKAARDVLPSPFPIATQMRGWNIDGVGPSKFGSVTPRRRRQAVSPNVVRKREPPEPVMKSGGLPGFQNAFMPSSPVLSSPQMRREKRKEREEVDHDQPHKAKGKEKSSFFTYSPQFASGMDPPNTPPSPTLQRRRAGGADVMMQDAGDEDDDDCPVGDVGMVVDDEVDSPFLELHDDFEPPNWKEELPRIILTHSLQSTTPLTVQTLITATFPVSVPASSTETYSSACSRLLGTIGTSSKYQDWEERINRLSSSLITMAHILNIARSIHPLTALLNLLTLLTFSLPSFSASLLSQSLDDANQRSPPLIITCWCNIVQDQLVLLSSPSDETHQSMTLLGEETIGFMEALCWNIPDEFVETLGFILHSRKVLSILLASSQPPWLLNRSTQLLVILASHSTLFRSLLAFPDPGTPRVEQVDKDFSRIPHIELLCSYLVDVGQRGEEVESMKINILTFFAILSISHVDALAILLESQTLIPSLVLFLFRLTTPLWEDNEMLMASPALVASSIRTMNQTVFLLHHLIFSSVSVFNLRHKLHYAPYRQFNGITHMFIVAFGRLSYADAPDWVNHSGKLELEKIAEMARDLLDLVVEGPECDSMWAVYQEEVDQKSDTDDEEMEARNLHSNEI